ncbi:MAG: pentapeptide repeat-containing protein [Desulfobacterales bacterium]|nr:pentapeptide repeat-containing protein [Desulfobacterales bacterium]
MNEKGVLQVAPVCDNQKINLITATMKTKTHRTYLSFALKLTIIAFSFSIFLGVNNLSAQVQENVDQLIKTNQCPDCNLTGADLNRLNLSGADLQRANLTGATFFLADLSDANLSGAILRGAQFGGADLANTDLSGADLRGATLSGAYLVGSKMDGTFVDVSISDDESLKDIKEKTYIPDDKKAKTIPEQDSVAISDRRDFHQVPPVIENSQLQTTKKIETERPSKADMQGAPPVKTITPVNSITIEEQKKVATEKQQPDEMKPVLEGLSTTNDAENTVIAEAATTISDETGLIESAGQEEPRQKKSTDQKRMVEQQQINSSESSADTPEDLASTSALKDKSLDETKSETTAKEKSTEAIAAPVQDDLLGVNNDVNQDIAHSVGNEAMPQQDIPSTEITETTMVTQNGTKTDSDINEKNSQSDSSETKTIESPTESDPTAPLIEQLLDTNKCYRCNLAGVDLSGKDLEDADLEGADFSGANLEKVDFSEANLKGASFVNAILINADFSKADLYKTNFSGADLTDADFSKAMLDEANFTDSRGYTFEMLDEKK